MRFCDTLKPPGAGGHSICFSGKSWEWMKQKGEFSAVAVLQRTP